MSTPSDSPRVWDRCCEAAGDSEKDRERPTAVSQSEGLYDDRYAAGNMIAPPTPWMARNTTIQASAKLPLGVSPHMPMPPRNNDPEYHHPPVPDGVCQPPTEREESSQGKEIGVHHPLDPSAR